MYFFFGFCVCISDSYLIWSLQNLNENFQCLCQEVLYRSIGEMAVRKLKLPHHMDIHSSLWIRIRMLFWCLPIQNAERCVVFGNGSKLKLQNFVIEVIFACSGNWMISGQFFSVKADFSALFMGCLLMVFFLAIFIFSWDWLYWQISDIFRSTILYGERALLVHLVSLKLDYC